MPKKPIFEIQDSVLRSYWGQVVMMWGEKKRSSNY